MATIRFRPEREGVDETRVFDGDAGHRVRIEEAPPGIT